MSDEEVTRIRPMGDLRIEIFRPLMRFGVGIVIGVVTSEYVYYASVQDGDFVWTRSLPNVAHDKPTLYMDDEMLNALYMALAKEPVQTRGRAPYDHLQDAISVRDRLLKLVEEGWAR